MDIAHILSLGYHVFAIEGVREAIDALNDENHFDLKFHKEDSTFQSPDGNLVIYYGNLFACPVEKWAPCHYIWDKGSLTAIDENDRSLYKRIMQKAVMSSDTDECKEAEQELVNHLFFTSFSVLFYHK